MFYILEDKIYENEIGKTEEDENVKFKTKGEEILLWKLWASSELLVVILTIWEAEENEINKKTFEEKQKNWNIENTIKNQKRIQSSKNPKFGKKLTVLYASET